VVRSIYIIFTFFLLGNTILLAQNDLKVTEVVVAKDTLKKSKINPLAPSKAAFYSAILPGLGQAYNKKYWKIPIVYAAIGTGIYSYSLNNKKYHEFRDAYKRRLAGFNDDQFQGVYDNNRLISGQRFHQKNRDLSMLITAGLYILNIVDANIDAHLMQFNVNDDLSVRPDFQQNDLNFKYNLGVTLVYNF
jgi:Family of unknown function (DUF5683)